MVKKQRKQPVIGCAYDPEQRAPTGNVLAMIDELEWYKPRGHRALIKEGHKIARQLDAGTAEAFENEWEDECMNLLTEWARRVVRHNYVSFVRDGGFAGFTINTESAQEDADLKVDDLSEVPRGFSGFVIAVNDHGNVTGYSYSRGRSRELFAVV